MLPKHSVCKEMCTLFLGLKTGRELTMRPNSQTEAERASSSRRHTMVWLQVLGQLLYNMRARREASVTTLVRVWKLTRTLAVVVSGA